MPMYRIKPSTVEARKMPTGPDLDQNQLARLNDMADWCDGDIFDDAVDGKVILFYTPDGEFKVTGGDWVIRSEGDAFSVISDPEFQERYEVVDDHIA